MRHRPGHSSIGPDAHSGPCARPMTGGRCTSTSPTCSSRSWSAALPTSTSPPAPKPMVRVRGRLVALEDYPTLDADGHARGRLLDPHERPAPAARDRLADRLRLRDPERRPLPRQRVLPARRARRRVPPHPGRDQVDRRARPAGRLPRARAQAARLRPRHGPDRLGQVDVARGDHRRDQHDAANDHILTIEDPIEFLHPHKKCMVNQREIGSDATTFAARPEGRAAPGPRRDPRRRDARPRDDLHRADRGGDRPPRLRDAPHPGRAADDRPHHRRLPARAAAAGPRAALGRAPGRHHPAAAADRRRRRPRRRVRGHDPDAGGPQPHPRGQDPPDPLGDADRLVVGHADDGRRARDARPPGPITQKLAEQRSSQRR